MEIDYPTGVQEPQLRVLWQLSFGDSEEFIAGFFASGYCPRRCRPKYEIGDMIVNSVPLMSSSSLSSSVIT